jgi:hypothetical protein
MKEVLAPLDSNDPVRLSEVSAIDIRFIPESEARVPGLGDWQFKDNILQIRVVHQRALHHDFLLALHELTEAWLCAAHGVQEADVDAFDITFRGDGEPGDDPHAPYRKEHRQSMLVEHMVANFLGLDNYGAVS